MLRETEMPAAKMPCPILQSHWHTQDFGTVASCLTAVKLLSETAEEHPCDKH